jgi:hypothetical protein
MARFKKEKMALPYGTLYFMDDAEKVPASWGAAKTDFGARRATLVKVGASEMFVRAFIYDRRTNKVLWRIKRTSLGITILRDIVENDTKPGRRAISLDQKQ